MIELDSHGLILVLAPLKTRSACDWTIFFASQLPTPTQAMAEMEHIEDAGMEAHRSCTMLKI